ncbi:oxidoreductase [Kitasatospora nipponensis]|uniref:oxidoreductase n=1 Tax=Kitasatospora nipponensis TaxID=258049 RepID=UPI0031D3E1F3
MIIQDGPTGLAQGVEAALAVAGRGAERARTRYRLDSGTARALVAAGFARHFVPARWGGAAGGFETLVDAVLDLSGACTAAAWCATLYAAHGRLAGYLPEQGQADLWAHSPDVLIAGAGLAPSGRAEAVPGGWRLSGEWGFVSGVDHAQWVLLAAWTQARAGLEHRVFAVPRGDLLIRDTWRGLGMRGTGSNTVVLADVLVPAHRTVPMAELAAARPPAAGRARCHQVPYRMVATLLFTTPIVGAATAAMTAWSAPPPGRVLDLQRELTRAATELRSARLLLGHAAARADLAAPGERAVAENLRDTSLTADLCVTAVDRLCQLTGGVLPADQDPVQRARQDVHTAAGHTALECEAASARYSDGFFDWDAAGGCC